MKSLDDINNELKLALKEIDGLIKEYPQSKYYKTLSDGIETIAADVKSQWPLEQGKIDQLRGMSAHVARLLDYPEPGDKDYELWMHIANIEDYITDVNV